MILLALVSLLMVIGLVHLGNERHNRFGKYNISYVDVIQWKGYSGPADIFPVLYVYFPLSFENFDRYVIQHKYIRTYGLNSIDWLITGFFKLNHIPEIRDLQEITLQYSPVSTGANVPTALAYFYSDFGLGAWVPMMLYMFLWLTLYKKNIQSNKYSIYYALISAGFALSSFQAIIIAPLLYHQIFQGFIVLMLSNSLIKKRKLKVTIQPAIEKVERSV